MKQVFIAGRILLLVFLLQGLTACYTPYRMSSSIQYYQPAWAPPYEQGERYYYFPDIEVYFDLEDEVFVYLHNGQWLFSPGLPVIYAGFDLYTGFIITLNYQVYQPWLHHQYYVSHYPRYYYHNIYQQDRDRIRGFNENRRVPFFWQPGEKDRAHELRKNPPPPRPVRVNRDPQETHYYGKPLGEPVKVKPVMKRVKEAAEQRSNPKPPPKQQAVPKKKRG